MIFKSVVVKAKTDFNPLFSHFTESEGRGKGVGMGKNKDNAREEERKNVS